MLASQNEVICAWLESALVSAELYLNGFPILRTTTDTPIVAESVHPYLIDGLNTLELLIETGPTPSRAREPHEGTVDKEATARVWLGGYRENAPVFPDQGRPIANISFARVNEPDHLKFPASFHASFDMGHWRGPLEWQDAPPLRLDDNWRTEALATVRHMIKLHTHGDVDGTLALLAPHLADFRRIFGWSEADLRARIVELVAALTDDPEAVLPWKEENTDFRVVAHGRLIQCIDKDWLPTVRVRTPTGQVLKKPLFLGRDGDVLRVFR